MADPYAYDSIYYPTNHRDGDLTKTNPIIDDSDPNKEQMVVKIGILGNQDVGKASFMRRYVRDEFNQHSSYGYYNNSPGSVLFLEKQISMKNVNLFLGLWCSTTYNIYESALQLVCQDANVVIFMFSLTNKASLNAIKSWYDQALAQNKQFIPILVGTKYDIVHENISGSNANSHFYLNQYHKMTRIARKYAMKMKASLIYISSKSNTNINHIIKVCVAKVFNIKHKLREYHWNTLKPLREHHVSRILKCWSNQKKMKYLICGYLKLENVDQTLANQKRIMKLFVHYLRYDLQPLSSHHHEGHERHSHRKGKSAKKKKTHRKKQAPLSVIAQHTKKRKRCHKSGKKKKKSSKKRRKSSRKQAPLYLISSHSEESEPGYMASIAPSQRRERDDVAFEGVIKI